MSVRKTGRFFDYVARGDVASYPRYDPIVREHPGLWHLHSLGFVWPSTEAYRSTGEGSGVLGLRAKHELSAVYGYSVARGSTEQSRRKALARAIGENNLGLRAVAEHIAGLVKLRKMQWTDKWENAIVKWEDDLDWLYENYYKNSVYSTLWPWPSTL